MSNPENITELLKDKAQEMILEQLTNEKSKLLHNLINDALLTKGDWGKEELSNFIKRYIEGLIKEAAREYLKENESLLKEAIAKQMTSSVMKKICDSISFNMANNIEIDIKVPYVR